MKKLLLAVTTALLALVASCEPAYAQTDASGPVARTFSAYDLTQCNCLYSPGGVQAFVYSAPLVRVTSYYDTTLYATQPYSRNEDINKFRLYNGKGSHDGDPIYTSSGQVAYVLCWDLDYYGHQFDKVGTRLTVDDTTTMYLVQMYDAYVVDGVRYSDHRC